MGGAVAASPTGEVVGSKQLFSKANVRPLIFCAVAVLGAVLYGYDGTYFTGILAMDKFKQDFGNDHVQADGSIERNISSSQESVLTSIVQAGEVVGSLLAGPIGDWGGRKAGFLFACAFVTVGVILQLIIAGSVPLLGTGRAVLGVGVGIISNATPLYLSEIPPTAIRGAVVSSWQLMLAIGQVIGACVDQGTKTLDNTGAYRIPIGLNLAIVLAIVAGMLFIPESPRWLISKDRDDEALAAITRINRDQEDDVREKVIKTEYDAFVQARQDERDMTGKGGWSTMLTGIERRKFICVLGILIGQQIGGVQFIFSYTTVFFESIGLNNSFEVTIIVDVIEVVGVLCSFLLVNRFGRRPLLLSTSAIMFIALFVVGGLGTIAEDQRTDTQSKVIAAMICIYVFFFNLAWGPLAWLMSLGTACFWIVAWAVTFTLPYLYNPENANLGPQIGWIYGVGTIIAALFVYFYIPETLGRSLEEINEMLEAKVPTRQWSTYITAAQREKGDNELTMMRTRIADGHADADAERSVEGELGKRDSESDRKKGGDKQGSEEGTHVRVSDANSVTNVTRDA